MITDAERIRRAVRFVPANDRDTWLRMGMAIKSELGEGGFEVWETWSRQDQSFDAKAARDVWKSIRGKGRVTIGTLFHEAKAHGWGDDGNYQKPTPKELAEVKCAAAERAAQAAQEGARIARERADAAKTAATLWGAAASPADHPYLTHKGIRTHGIRQHLDALVIPLRIGGELLSLQFIGADGGKRFLPGGRVAGCYFSIGDPTGAHALAICEGFATGASIHEATGLPVAISFNAGNLLAVARTMRERYPDLRLIVCADDDWKTEGNPGVAKATEAARSVGGVLAIPVFGDERPDRATDFNDLATLRGREAVKGAMANAKEPAIGENQANPGNAAWADLAPVPKLIRASEVASRPIEWLWRDWLAAGKLHIVGGAPGLAKTTVALAWAATVTEGGRWPDGSRCRAPGSVVIWSGEDSIADTLRPRLEAMGAVLDNVHFVGAVPTEGGDRPFDPATDSRGLMHAVGGLQGVKLLIIDPIVSAIAGDSHKNAEVRRGLQPLVDLAEKLGIALVGITHFSKGTSGRDPLERLTGSLAFGALARLVFGAAKLKDEDGNEFRALVRIKSNIGPDGGGFRYDVNHAENGDGIIASRIGWGEAIEGAAREILADDCGIDDSGEASAANDARRFLESLLTDAPLSAKKVFIEADGAGFAKRTIQRAADRLGVLRHKDGMRGGWVWKLAPKMPTTPEDAVDASPKTLAPSAPSAPSAGSSRVEVEI